MKPFLSEFLDSVDSLDSFLATVVMFKSVKKLVVVGQLISIKKLEVSKTFGAWE